MMYTSKIKIFDSHQKSLISEKKGQTWEELLPWIIGILLFVAVLVFIYFVGKDTLFSAGRRIIEIIRGHGV